MKLKPKQGQKPTFISILHTIFKKQVSYLIIIDYFTVMKHKIRHHVLRYIHKAFSIIQDRSTTGVFLVFYTCFSIDL